MNEYYLMNKNRELILFTIQSSERYNGFFRLFSAKAHTRNALMTKKSLFDP